MRVPTQLTGLPMLVLLLLVSCSRDEEVGTRYRLEREIWHVNREASRLSLRPELVDDAEWHQVAERYERIVSEYSEYMQKTVHHNDAVSREIRYLMARALVNSAQVYAAVGDSVKMLRAYEQVATRFDDLQDVAVEVALAQGRVAEASQKWEKAAAHYQILLDRLEPAPGEPGPAGVLTSMPISIARLKTRDLLDSNPPGDVSDRVREFYTQARSYYDKWASEQPGTRLELESIRQRASVATDLGEWIQAIALLEALEDKLLVSGNPLWDPAEIRYAIAMTQNRVDTLVDSSKATLRALVDDYPESQVVPAALLSLATVSPTEEALGYLDRLRNEHRDSEAYLTRGQLTRARILESNGRWTEASEVLRSLPMEQPVSEVALQAPLEIIGHYQRVGDAARLAEALSKAETQYRDFIARYPSNALSVSAHARLVQVLYLQERYEDAIAELLALSDSMGKSPGAAPLLIEAAKMARDQLGDQERALEILKQTVAQHAGTEAGRWAADEVARLQRENPE